MRHLLLLSAFFPFFSSAQTSLTRAASYPREGDSLVMRRVMDIRPGAEGRDALWDFSDKKTGRTYVMQYTMEGDTLSAADGGTSWRIVLLPQLSGYFGPEIIISRQKK